MNVVEFPQSRCRAAVVQRDITPPVGIYHRMWGAASHDRSTGVHRPLWATALLLATADPAAGKAPGNQLLVLGLDHCLMWKDQVDRILSHVSQHCGMAESDIVIAFSHTHAAGLMGLERRELPGGDLIPGYLDSLQATLAEMGKTVSQQLQPVHLAYATGRCDLATNRDFWDQQQQSSVCGFNPQGPTDDAVIAARVETATGQTLATIVNYACHPTTLAWQNKQISPDYVGAMREVIQDATAAPCLFLQGASGDLGPREGYVGETEVADRNGRQLGFAALSALTGLPAAGTCFQYTGPVVSGATLGTWQSAPLSDDRQQTAARWQSASITLQLPYREGLPRGDQLQADRQRWQAVEAEARQRGDDVAAADARAMIERLVRRLVRLAHLPPGDNYPYTVVVRRMGDAYWVLLDGEHYHWLQRRLREQFPGTPIVVITLANGSVVWYLPTSDAYGKGLYQEDASILARGSLESIADAAAQLIHQLKDS